MAIYTYDAEADVVYVLLVDDESAAIERTEELDPALMWISMAMVGSWESNSSTGAPTAFP